jgi:hypothetical protein
VSEKAKLIRGDPPKIALKRRGSPLKIDFKHAFLLILRKKLNNYCNKFFVDWMVFISLSCSLADNVKS